jgi:hypothetical protein
MTEPSPTPSGASPAVPAPAASAPASAPQPTAAQPAAAGSPSAAGASPASTAPVAPAGQSAIPSGLPEEFWDATAGAVKFEDLGREIAGLRTIRAEREAMRAGVPEKPDGYAIALPADFKMPDGVEFSVAEDDPVVPLVREFAHKHGLSQEALSELVAVKARADLAQGEQVKAMLGRQIEALGPNGANRINAVQDWLSGRLGESGQHLVGSLVTAAQVQAYEALMRQFSGAGVPPLNRSGFEQKSAISDEDYAAMSPYERVNAARKANAASARR